MDIAFRVCKKSRPSRESGASFCGGCSNTAYFADENAIDNGGVNATLNDTADNKDSISIDEIDFSKYQTKELAEKVGELISVPRTIFQLLYMVFGCFALAAALIVFWLKGLEYGVMAFVIGIGYAAFASIIFGVPYWLVFSIRKSFSSILEIVDLIFETTWQVASDLIELCQGKKRLPPIASLINAVYEKIFRHILKQAITSTPLFGGLFYWAYESTIDRILKIVVRRALAGDKAGEEADKKEIEAVIESMPEREKQMTARIRWVQKNVVGSGAWLTKKLLWPFYAMLVLLVCVLAVPVLSMWFFS